MSEEWPWPPPALAPRVTATGHPAAVLRMRDAGSRARAMQALVDDLKQVRGVLDGGT